MIVVTRPASNMTAAQLAITENHLATLKVNRLGYTANILCCYMTVRTAVVVLLCIEVTPCIPRGTSGANRILWDPSTHISLCDTRLTARIFSSKGIGLLCKRTCRSTTYDKTHPPVHPTCGSSSCQLEHKCPHAPNVSSRHGAVPSTPAAWYRLCRT